VKRGQCVRAAVEALDRPDGAADRNLFPRAGRSSDRADCRKCAEQHCEQRKRAHGWTSSAVAVPAARLSQRGCRGTFRAYARARQTSKADFSRFKGRFLTATITSIHERGAATPSLRGRCPRGLILTRSREAIRQPTCGLEARR